MTEEKMPGDRWWWRKKLPVAWLAAAALLGVVMLSLNSLAGRTGAVPAPPAVSPRQETSSVPDQGLAAVERELEQRLEGVLGQIDGVGNVSATVILAVGPQREYASNLKTDQRTTDEKDQSGGSRVISEANQDAQLVLSRSASGGGEEPVVVKESRPVVQGVLVVAGGAEDAQVRLRVSQAVETLLDVQPHQVQVLPGESR